MDGYGVAAGGPYGGRSAGYAPQKRHSVDLEEELAWKRSRLDRERFSPGSPNPDADPSRPEGKQKEFHCRLCQNRISFSVELNFLIHLSVIHYKERLMSLISEPLRWRMLHF
jgi:hypothetical protein